MIVLDMDNHSSTSQYYSSCLESRNDATHSAGAIKHISPLRFASASVTASESSVGSSRPSFPLCVEIERLQMRLPLSECDMKGHTPWILTELQRDRLSDDRAFISQRHKNATSFQA